MRRLLPSSLVGIAVTALPAAPALAQLLWINEFHYDNSGTDTAEFVEIAAPEGFTDLGSVRLTLYNGGDGAPYGSPHSLGGFTRGETVGGLTFYSKSIPGLQNGAPDGLALDRGGTLLHFISYEGTFTAKSGPALGALSSEVGLSEGESTPAGASLGFRGTGATLADFTWAAFGVATPGFINPGQAAVPEPHEYALAFGGGLGLFAVWRRRQASAARSSQPRTLPAP